MKRFLWASLVLIMGLAGVYFLVGSGNDLAEPEPLYWQGPMHKQVISDKPGVCSICGMGLKPVYAKEEAGSTHKSKGSDDLGIVHISPAVVNNLGVRAEPVQKSPLFRQIEAVGYVQFNEDSLHHIHTRVDGWIEKLNVDSVGDPIRKGQVLFEIYSPELVNAQEEYVTAIASGNKQLTAASRQRLALLGATDVQINQLAKTRKVMQRLEVLAHKNGYVSALNVRHGMFVNPAKEVLATGDLNSVWVVAEVFERQAAWIKTGQQVIMRADSYPGRDWRGSVEYIYPVLNQQSRTLQVRVRFDNPDELLKPNMFTTLDIDAGDDQPRLNIPRAALIRGGRNDRVVMALGEGRYQSVGVKAGIESGDRVEILDGLAEGDSVVTSAQFLIDSESSLDAEMARMEGAHEHH